MTGDDVRDMYVAREAIERAAARKILQGEHVTAGKVLLDVVSDMAAAVAVGDATGVGEVDIVFHERLVQLAGSPRLSWMHQTFITETRMCIHALEETYSASEVQVEEHHALAQAIKAGGA